MHEGHKEACSTGHCGACSVLVDGKLTRSCVTLVRRLDGKVVETIENAPHDTMLQTIQRSFLDVGAVQCGFCTPGMVMAAKALLLHNAAPDEPAIYDGLKNNYCRCTGYVKIIEAVKLAAARLRGEDPSIDTFRDHESTVIVVGEDQVVPPITGSAVGRSVWDVDGMDKTGGKLKFCDDYTAEDIGADTLLHGAFVWAPAPHAKINAVDYSAAEQAEGVVRIVTAADVPGMNKIGTWTPEQPVFSTDEVNFLGDHLALVVADTAAHARAAVKLVKIDYEELPGIYTMADGYRKNSFIVHTGRVSGDVEQAKQRTDIVKLNVSKDIEPQEHACMEPVSAIGMVQDGKTILYSCTQAPFEIRSMLAKILNKPEEDIRVIVTPLGGGFGKKMRLISRSTGGCCRSRLRQAGQDYADAQGGFDPHYQTPWLPYGLRDRLYAGRQVPVSGLPHVLRRRTVRVRKLRHADDRRADERRPVHHSQCQGRRLGDPQQQSAGRRVPRLRHQSGCDLH